MSAEQGWTALVLAGSRPGVDPFAEEHGAAVKALIPVAGEPMVVHPVRALLASPQVREVRVLSQQPDLLEPVLPSDPRLRQSTSSGTIAETLLAICDDPATQWPLLVTTADHVLLDREMVAEFTRASAGADVAVALVERRPLLARFPDAQRTWLKFRGGAYSGANLFSLTSPRARAAIAQWRAVEQDRKRGWRVVAQFGLPLLLGAVLRLRTIHQTAAALGRKLAITLRPIELSNPIAAVDVDKQADLELVERILAGQA